MGACLDSSKRRTDRSRTGMATMHPCPRTSSHEEHEEHEGVIAMRVVAVVIALLAIAPPAVAQEWDEFVAMQDGFRINFPGTPQVTTGTWTSQMNYTLPMRVYSAAKGRERYSVTVVDYSSIEQQGIERGKSC